MIYPSVGNLPVLVPRWIGRGLIHTGAPKHGMLVYRSASRMGGKKRRRTRRRGKEEKETGERETEREDQTRNRTGPDEKSWSAC